MLDKNRKIQNLTVNIMQMCGVTGGSGGGAGKGKGHPVTGHEGPEGE
jgi:hypothetical protein